MRLWNRLRVVCSSESGFTMTELLATTLVITVGVFAVINMFQMGIKTSGDASVRQLAVNVANEKIELMRTIDFDDLTSYNLMSQLGYTEQRNGRTFTFYYNVQTGIDDPNDADGDGIYNEDGNEATGYNYKVVTIRVHTYAPQLVSFKVNTIVTRTPKLTGEAGNDQVSPVWNSVGTALTTGVQIGARSIYLQWSITAADGHELTDAGSGVAGFYVYRGDLIVAIIAPAYNYFVDTIPDDPVNFPLGTTYTYKVKAFDVAGNTTDFTNGRTLTTIANSAPTAPGSLTGTPIGSYEVDLAWSASSDDWRVVGYKIYRDNVFIAEVTGTPPAYGDVPLSYADTGLLPGTLYVYKVTAVDAEGAESTAATVTVTTGP